MCMSTVVLRIPCSFLQAVDRKVAQLKELTSSNRQGQPHEVIDRYNTLYKFLTGTTLHISNEITLLYVISWCVYFGA